MSVPPQLSRARRAGVALAVGIAFASVPAVAQAAAVDLATAGPFVVLGGSTVTNTGPSVLNGDLGVSPGTSLTGFGLPAVVNGATHANDAVAAQAQLDLTTAYDVAAGQPVAPADDLTGQDLGGLALTAGAYRYASSAQLTGALTLDAEGDPNAQFVFQIGSTLTTASASSVVLVNGASPCNVFWQVGSSATLGSTTGFQGNVMALTDISLNNGASVTGRLLARDGQISLINNVLSRGACATGSTPGTTPAPDDSGSTPVVTSPAAPAPGDGGTAVAPQSGGAQAGADQAGQAGAGAAGAGAGARPSGTASTRTGTAVLTRTARPTCTDGFRATVRGRLIERVVFTLDGKPIASRARSPFQVTVRAVPGRHELRARVTFKDATRTRSLRLRYRTCAEALLSPRQGPSPFTG